MSFNFSQFVFTPTIAMIASSVMLVEGLEKAIVDMGAQDPAERDGSPLNNIAARAYNQSDGDDLAEFAGRQCYRSWNAGREPAVYHENIRMQGHGSIYEHAAISFQITGVSRTLTHELIRHRVGTAYSQESQRYVDAKDIRFVVPPLLGNAVIAEVGHVPTCANDFDGIKTSVRKAFQLFHRSCRNSLEDYVELQSFLTKMAEEAEADSGVEGGRAIVSAKKRANEASRSVLHNAAETRLVFTCNLRELRHVMTLRGDEPADLEIRRMALALLPLAKEYAPHFFSDLDIVIGTDGNPNISTKEVKRI